MAKVTTGKPELACSKEDTACVTKLLLGDSADLD
jgi:hypothetical protein